MHSIINHNLWISGTRLTCANHFCNLCIAYPLNDQLLLLINGLTGAVDIISSDEYYILKNNPQSYTDAFPKSAHLLAERGYLFQSQQHEIDLKNNLIQNIKKRSSEQETLFMLCPTDYCPMGCAYCFAGDRTLLASKKAIKKSVVDASFRAIKQLMQWYPGNLSRVILYGGEPFQNFTQPALKHIFQSAQNNNLQIAAFSNGMAIYDFKELLNDFAKDISIISVTLDGIGNKHNGLRKIKCSFDNAVRSIDTLLNIGIQVQIKLNVRKNNMKDIPELVGFFKKKGWWDDRNIIFELNPIQFTGIKLLRDTQLDIELGLDFLSTIEKYPEYAKFDFLPLIDNKYHLINALGIYSFPDNIIPINARVPRISHCPSYSHNMFVFSADGGIYLCNERLGRKEAQFGIWEKEYRFEKERMEKHFQRDITSNIKCSLCPFGFFCGAGCGLNEIIGTSACATIREDFQLIIDHYKDRILSSI